MNIGTKSLLFGIHQFAIHPWFVAWAWWKLYGFPKDPRLWVAFIVHDWGYWGCPNMDGPEGEKHVELGARIMEILFGAYWKEFCLRHSRFYSKNILGKNPGPLCAADKLAIYCTWQWLHLILGNLSGEIHEYMEGKNARTPGQNKSQRQWLTDVQAYCKAWAIEHKDCKEDLWTGTKRDLECN